MEPGRSTVQQDVLHGPTLISERTREAPLLLGAGRQQPAAHEAFR